jgi:hypothetical protein
MDMDKFRQDISDANLLSHDSLSDLTFYYNNTLQQLLDKHAPLKTKTITERPQAEWYTAELEKRGRRESWRDDTSEHSPPRMHIIFSCSVHTTVRY